MYRGRDNIFINGWISQQFRVIISRPSVLQGKEMYYYYYSYELSSKTDNYFTIYLFPNFLCRYFCSISALNIHLLSSRTEPIEFYIETFLVYFYSKLNIKKYMYVHLYIYIYIYLFDLTFKYKEIHAYTFIYIYIYTYIYKYI